MSRILAYTSPARGHLYPIVPVLRELRSRGHDVFVRTLASQVELMREQNIDAQPICERIEALEHDDYKGRSQPARIKRALATFTARAELEVPDLRAAINADRPDAILVDCMTWGAIAAAQAWGGPWAQFFPYPMPLPPADAPLFGPGLRPAHGALGHLRDRALRSALARPVDQWMLAPVNSMRSTAGVPALASMAEMLTLAPLVLYLTAEPFEYRRRRWPACVQMVGPCPWDPPAEPPSWLARIVRPLILVSTSSERQDDRRLVITALEAFAQENVELVATLPAGGADGIEVPANAHVERFLPHAPLLARAACAITHGGAGVTQKALAAGVPVCAVPFGRDQHEVARRVELVDAGVRLPARRLTARRLRAKVRKAMTRRPGARRVADAFAAAGGALAAADAFEKLAGGAPGSSAERLTDG